jgi:hypothetical protein
MRYFILILFSFITLICEGQSGTFTIDWNGYKNHSIGSKSINLPYFNNNYTIEDRSIHFVYSYLNDGLVDPNSLEINNVVSEVISNNELKDLDRSKIPSEIESSLSNALSRKRNFIQLYISPIYKDKGQYRKITSFTYSYQNLLVQKSTTKSSRIGNSMLTSGNWYKIRVTRTGVQRINRSFLSNLGVNVNNLDPRKIKVYGHGGTSLSLINGVNQFFDPPEIAIQVIGENDGRIDATDQVLFYGIATDSEYVEENDSFINPYTNDSFYYINVEGANGKRIEAQTPPTAAPTASYDYFHARKNYEVDERNIGQIGRKWYGERFGFEPEQSFEFTASNVISSRPTRVNITVAAISDTGTSMTASVNGQNIGATTLRGLAGNNTSTASRGSIFNNNLNLNSNTLTVDLSFNNNGNPGAQGFLDYIWLDVPQTLQGGDGQFKFRNLEADATSGIGEFIISNASDITDIWDVTDRFNVTTYANVNGDANFSIRAATGSPKEYIAVARGDFFTPQIPNDSRVSNSNLKGTIFLDSSGRFNDIDYLIITPAFLRSEAQRLANFHITENNLNTKVVVLDDIYREFSEDVQDIAAIRNFVKYVYDNASDPSRRVQYLNMFGDASFDYKNRIQIRDNIVPTYLSSNSTSLTISYCTDDFFTFMNDGEGNLDRNNLMDIAVGRMIVSNISEARQMVDKVISYSDEPAFKSWRNNITLIGDDVDILSDRILQSNVSDLGDEIFLNKPNYNVRKILLDSYQQLSSAGGNRYPDAVDDIKNAFEQGSLVINYFGHGNEDGLAQEFVVTQSLVENLRHPDALPLFITVTCEFTRYDNPLRVSGGEKAYLNPDGGAIATVATNRLILVSTGSNFNRILDEYLFAYDNVEPTSIAESLRLSKVDPRLSNDGTRRVIAYVGDPALKLAFPKPEVVLTTLNGNPLLGNTDVLQALAPVSLGGEIRDLTGNKIDAYNGVLNITVYDKEIERQTLANDNTRDSSSTLVRIDFGQLGEVLFRGQATITNGEFTVNFVMPRDTQIPIGNGRVSFYAKRDNEKEDQNGFSQDIRIGGIDRNAPEDDAGPEVDLFMNDTNFVSGGITDNSPFLLAFLNDDNGINTSSGIGHDIVGILDGDETNPFILNDYYEAEVDDFTRGKVYFPLRDIEPGLHTLEVKAWDTYNNSAVSEIQFVVSDSDGIELTRVLNYPNPFNSYTEFWFNHNRPFEPLDVQVKVMTVSGKVVWSKIQNITTTGFTSREITWDGRDDFGQRLGKGVYIYKIDVKSTLTNQTASKIEKLVIL